MGCRKAKSGSHDVEHLLVENLSQAPEVRPPVEDSKPARSMAEDLEHLCKASRLRIRVLPLYLRIHDIMRTYIINAILCIWQEEPHISRLPGRFWCQISGRLG